MKHGCDAVLNIEIAFALQAVAEDFQAVWMFAHLLVEIKDVAMGVAFAEDRDEAEDVAFKLVALTVRGDHRLAGEFGAGIK